MTAIAMLVVSIDRLISIIRPIFYYKKMLNIQHYLIISSNLLIFLLISASVVCSYLNNISVDSFCWTPNSRCPIFNRIYYGTRISAAVGSIVLYIITLFIVRRYNKGVKKRQNTQSANISKRQLKFTKTVGLSCSATASLYVLPMIVAFYEISEDKIPNTLFVIIVLIFCLNSFSKTVIIGYRLYEIRESIIDLMPSVFSKFGIHKTRTVSVVEFKSRQRVNATIMTTK
ncbi:unnamed protein product [Acanthocheilonema viteae]|uniref:G-protein coupled receptors family 1 profile domain-containing protein n=1 Tax=Acanthocheilonema viteae TaxID=6277 RepID=A0A498SYI8_ACAVI|nr:unnamed protein product [Acanthocheilonema viteae]